jgi:hypothetical protein
VEVVEQKGAMAAWDWRPRSAGTFQVKVSVQDGSGARVESEWSDPQVISPRASRSGFIAVLPVENLTGRKAPLEGVSQLVHAKLKEDGFRLVDERVIDEFMKRHRIRHSGGLSWQSSRAANEETGAEAVLITSLETYQDRNPPRISLASRLVAVDQVPEIVWMDSVGLAGEDSAGLLGLGRVGEPEVLVERAVESLVASLAAYLPEAAQVANPDPLPDDTDRDGVWDDVDRCRGFDDEIDSDGDGQPDGCDPCPLESPDDTDADGVCNSLDQCAGFDDGADGDGDGQPDGCDPCPLDDPDDLDGDGVCNSGDQCPGFDDALDSDGDGSIRMATECLQAVIAVRWTTRTTKTVTGFATAAISVPEATTRSMRIWTEPLMPAIHVRPTIRTTGTGTVSATASTHARWTARTTRTGMESATRQSDARALTTRSTATGTAYPMAAIPVHSMHRTTRTAIQHATVSTNAPVPTTASTRMATRCLPDAIPVRSTIRMTQTATESVTATTSVSAATTASMKTWMAFPITAIPVRSTARMTRTVTGCATARIPVRSTIRTIRTGMASATAWIPVRPTIRTIRTGMASATAWTLVRTTIRMIRTAIRFAIARTSVPVAAIGWMQTATA